MSLWSSSKSSRSHCNSSRRRCRCLTDWQSGMRTKKTLVPRLLAAHRSFLRKKQKMDRQTVGRSTQNEMILFSFIIMSITSLSFHREMQRCSCRWHFLLTDLQASLVSWVDSDAWSPETQSQKREREKKSFEMQIFCSFFDSGLLHIKREEKQNVILASFSCSSTTTAAAAAIAGVRLSCHPHIISYSLHTLLFPISSSLYPILCYHMTHSSFGNDIILWLWKRGLPSSYHIS